MPLLPAANPAASLYFLVFTCGFAARTERNPGAAPAVGPGAPALLVVWGQRWAKCPLALPRGRQLLLVRFCLRLAQEFGPVTAPSRSPRAVSPVLGVLLAPGGAWGERSLSRVSAATSSTCRRRTPRAWSSTSTWTGPGSTGETLPRAPGGAAEAPRGAQHRSPPPSWRCRCRRAAEPGPGGGGRACPKPCWPPHEGGAGGRQRAPGCGRSPLKGARGGGKGGERPPQPCSPSTAGLQIRVPRGGMCACEPLAARSTRLAMLSNNLTHWKKLPLLPSLTNQPHQVLASDPVPFADLQQVRGPWGSPAGGRWAGGTEPSGAVLPRVGAVRGARRGVTGLIPGHPAAAGGPPPSARAAGAC